MKGCFLIGASMLILFLLVLCSLPMQIASVGATMAGKKTEIEAVETACAQQPSFCPQSSKNGTGTSSNWTPPTGTASGLSIAYAASSMAKHLSGSPAKWYDGFPASLMTYYQQICQWGSGCWDTWQNGNLQCVMFVRGAYFLAGYPIGAMGNAVEYWTNYRGLAGWQRIAPSQGYPAPGDIIVWSSTRQPNGHIAVVLEFHPPQGERPAMVTFAQANAGVAVETQTIRGGKVETWAGYSVLGYIRKV